MYLLKINNNFTIVLAPSIYIYRDRDLRTKPRRIALAFLLIFVIIYQPSLLTKKDYQQHSSLHIEIACQLPNIIIAPVLFETKYDMLVECHREVLKL